MYKAILGFDKDTFIVVFGLFNGSIGFVDSVKSM